LAWDLHIRCKIRKIFVPNGAKPIAFQDPAVIQKTFESDDIYFPLSTNSALHVLRSQPQNLNDNSDCLLAIFESAGKRALIGGDYVYRHYQSDGHAGINALHTLEFDALVVPHHGDAASAMNIVTARPGAVAFFSAGTHQKYKHPKDVSRKAHLHARFAEICDPKCVDIVQRQLI
jgi:beta-lactamase superfamily II metal-dependent hydrolase